VVVLPEYQRDGIDARGHYVVVQQEFEWDGGLRAKLVGVMEHGEQRGDTADRE